MFKFCLLGLLLAASSVQAMEAGSLFTWDDHESGTGLHVSFQGKDKVDKNWAGREVQKQDTSFYQSLFSDPEVVKTMDDGRTVELEKTETQVKTWLERFAHGTPWGGLVIEQDQQSVGTLMVVKKGPGIATFGRAFTPSMQGKGLGTAVLGFLVEEWAPAVRKIGLGQDLAAPLPAADKFKYFDGEALKLIYTTARPSNIASWGSYKKFGFIPSPTMDKTHQINCEEWEKSQHGPFEDYIISAYFSPTASEQLQVDVLYDMLDEKGEPRTLSFVSEYGSLRYHFEREVIF